MNRPFKTLLVLTLASLALAGCGDSGRSVPAGTPANSSPAGGSPAGDSSLAAAAGTSLAVQLLGDGENPSDTWTLQCEDAAPLDGSDAPDPAAACAVLAERGAALFAAPDPNLMCTQEIRGMQRAKVTGVVEGEAVSREFSLRNGCEISHWESLTALLGPAEGTL